MWPLVPSAPRACFPCQHGFRGRTAIVRQRRPVLVPSWRRAEPKWRLWAGEKARLCGRDWPSLAVRGATRIGRSCALGATLGLPGTGALAAGPGAGAIVPRELAGAAGAPIALAHRNGNVAVRRDASRDVKGRLAGVSDGAAADAHRIAVRSVAGPLLGNDDDAPVPVEIGLRLGGDGRVGVRAEQGAQRQSSQRAAVRDETVHDSLHVHVKRDARLLPLGIAGLYPHHFGVCLLWRADFPALPRTVICRQCRAEGSNALLLRRAGAS